MLFMHNSGFGTSTFNTMTMTLSSNAQVISHECVPVGTPGSFPSAKLINFGRNVIQMDWIAASRVSTEMVYLPNSRFQYWLNQPRIDKSMTTDTLFIPIESAISGLVSSGSPIPARRIVPRFLWRDEDSAKKFDYVCKNDMFYVKIFLSHCETILFVFGRAVQLAINGLAARSVGSIA